MGRTDAGSIEPIEWWRERGLRRGGGGGRRRIDDEGRGGRRDVCALPHDGARPPPPLPGRDEEFVREVSPPNALRTASEEIPSKAYGGPRGGLQSWGGELRAGRGG